MMRPLDSAFDCAQSIWSPPERQQRGSLPRRHQDLVKARAEDQGEGGHYGRHIIEKHIAAQESASRPNTRRHREGFRNHLASLHGRPIDGVTRRDVAVAIADVAAEHDKISAKQARSALNMFFIWAVKEGYAESSPVALTNDPAPDVCPNKGRDTCF
jgi:hypothetical protein